MKRKRINPCTSQLPSTLHFTSTFPLGSRVPVELADEIAGHNADDVLSLRAMSLVSKTMRSSAITHLFSIVHFACVEDFSRWLDMLERTPRLKIIVKKVKFSDPDSEESWVRRHRGSQSVTRLAHAPVPPTIPPMPNVRVVEWAPASNFGVADPDPTIGIAYMALFPSIKKLFLRNIRFSRLVPLTNFVGACGSLKGLSLTRVGFDESEPDSDDLDDTDDRSDGSLPLTMVHRPRLGPSHFDLTNLEELAVVSLKHHDLKKDYLVELLEISPPAALKSLSFSVLFDLLYYDTEACSLTTIEKLVRLGARSVINLTIEPTFRVPSKIHKILEILENLPTLPALDSLTIFLDPHQQAPRWITALTAAPNLTTLILRIVFNQYHDDWELTNLDKLLHSVFPWGAPWDASESMKSALTRIFRSFGKSGSISVHTTPWSCISDVGCARRWSGG
ncbi:hypothetical protein C8R44DRAFT_988770 [Mycena epipterygia]|nr:hypothetical protein C8R44DRAFT_988770 [Mycena epipterygia]